jgi:hypothetical protein
MSAKKIIMFIVEGITDKICLGYVLDQLLSDQSVQFTITYGDITTKTGHNRTNIAAKVGGTVKEFSGKIYRPKDFLEVVHLIDVDGAYVADDKVIQAPYEKPFYTDENILTNKVDDIQRRNRQKREVLNRLITLGKVWGTIPYSVYYFSCNLDHVLHNEPNLGQRKTPYAERFEREYADQPTTFVEFLSNKQYAVDGEYQQTWDFIKIDTNSLQRRTNFHLYFNNLENDNTP